MKLSFIYLFFVIISMRSSAQTISINENDLLGTWLYGSNLTDSDTTTINYFKHTITQYTFLPSGDFEFKYFRITKLHNDTCLQSEVSGTWKLKNNELTIAHNAVEGGLFAGAHWGKAEWSKEQLVKVNRDSIVVFSEGFYNLENQWIDASAAQYYKRLNKAIAPTVNGKDSCNNWYNLQPLILQALSFLPKSNYKYLINSLDSTEAVMIPEDRNIELYYEEQLVDSIYTHKSFYGLGFLDSICDDSILVAIYEMDISLWSEESYDGVTNTTSVYGNLTPSFLATIDLYNMPVLGFSTNGSDVFQSLSAFGMASGIFTALILAPLLSINYSSGEFRSQRYYRIAGYSLMAASISIPIYLLSMPKSYTIIPKDGDIDKNHWYLSY